MPLKLFGMPISRWSQSAESVFIAGMGLMRTDRTDEEIRHEIISVANENRAAIEEALKQIKDSEGEPPSYVTDRALRVFTAAVQNGLVPPVDSDHAELYERERRLERLPLDAAVAELGELSPAVRRYCEDVRERKEASIGMLAGLERRGLTRAWKRRLTRWSGLSPVRVSRFCVRRLPVAY